MSNYLLSVLFIHLIQIHVYDYVLKVLNTGQFRDPVKRKKKKENKTLVFLQHFEHADM